jgi:hypothetical protein
MRTKADLVDRLFNSSEKRLARILLLMAEFGKPGEPQTFISPITQETLAEMIGTTRSRVSFFMNRFRRPGFIDYNAASRSTSRCSMWCVTISFSNTTPGILRLLPLQERFSDGGLQASRCQLNWRIER